LVRYYLKFTHGEDDPRAKAESIVAGTVEVKEPVEVVSNLPPGIFVPEPQPDFWVSEKVTRQLYTINGHKITFSKENCRAGCPTYDICFSNP